MKRSAKSRVYKTSISMPRVVADRAKLRAVKDAHPSFSAYVAHLIRCDRAEAQRTQTKYPPQ
jgi:hypothetical protein